jgi:hypothetical protein
MRRQFRAAVCLAAAALAGWQRLDAQQRAGGAAIPRTADGKPDLHGIWQVRNRAARDLENRDAKDGLPGTIPYQPWAAAKKADNFAKRETADPLSKCYMPGVPRIMYMEYPFEIFQTASQVAILFEWSQAFRLIYTNGTKPPAGIDFWMGDSRGRWEGDTLVVAVTNHNDKTWLDMAGNFHGAAMRLTERYTLASPDVIRYEVTVDDPEVFTKPWTMAMPLYRRTDLARLLEYQCNAEAEEASGAFPRDPHTWYPKSGATR